MAFHPVLVDDDHLPRLHVAHEVGTDDVETAGLRRHHPGFLQPSQHQRTHPGGVAGGNQLLLRQGHQRIGTDNALHRADQPLDELTLVAAGHQIQDHLRIGGRLEPSALRPQFLLDLPGIGQVAVVGQRETAGFVQIGPQRLDVADHGPPRRGIAGVADGGAPGQPRDRTVAVTVRRALAEHVADQPQRAMHIEMATVEGNDAAGFLSAMLQGMQAEGRQSGGAFGTPDAKDGAFLMEMVVVEREGRPGSEGAHSRSVTESIRRSRSRFCCFV